MEKLSFDTVVFSFEGNLTHQVNNFAGSVKKNGLKIVTSPFEFNSGHEKACIIVDSPSGAEYARNAAFGAIIGVKKGSEKYEIFAAGADFVSESLENITPEKINKWFERTPFSLKDYYEENVKPGDNENPAYSRSGKAALFSPKKPVFFFDYDGTLAPIVSRPHKAVMPNETRDVIKSLAEKYTVAVISGREINDIKNLVGLDNLIYSGNHGVEICGPGFDMFHPDADKVKGNLLALSEKLTSGLKDFDKVAVGYKGFSISVHFREEEDSKASKIESYVTRVVRDFEGLRVMSGNKVFEILPDINWNKGTAVQWIMDAFNIKWYNFNVIFFGDDVTDEDAFRTIRTRGTGILVARGPRPSGADFYVKSPEEVREILLKYL